MRLGKVWGRSPRPLCAAPQALALRLLPQARKAGEGSARSPSRERGRERPRACHSEPAVTAWGRGWGALRPGSPGSRRGGEEE